MMGTVILRLITDCPLTLSATSFWRIFADENVRCSASITALEFMMCLSTIVCGSSGMETKARQPPIPYGIP